jgi:hypothetical protein
MDFGAIFTGLAQALPKLRTKIQLAGFVVLAATVLIAQVFSPGDIIGSILGCLTGVVILGLGLILPTPEKYEMGARPYVVLAPFGLSIIVFLLFGFGYVYFLVLAEGTVDVYLRYGDEQLAQDFTLTYTIPGRGPAERHGEKGHADIRGVPRSSKEIQLDFVALDGYKPEGGPKFSIEGGNVFVPMISTGPVRPWSRKLFPNPSADMPPKAQVESESKIPGKRVLLTATNKTGDELFLVLYNCSVHYRSDEDANDWDSRWTKLPFPANKPEIHFNKFEKASGWYLIYVATRDQRFYLLQCENLYDTNRPTIVVTKGGDADEPYEAAVTKETANEDAAVVD